MGGGAPRDFAGAEREQPARGGPARSATAAVVEKNAATKEARGEWAGRVFAFGSWRDAATDLAAWKRRRLIQRYLV